MPKATTGRTPQKLCSTTCCYGNAVVFDPKHLCAKCLKAQSTKSTKDQEKEDGSGEGSGEGA